MMKKALWSFDAHQHCGQTLYALREMTLSSIMYIGNMYKKRHTRRLFRLLNSVDRLRSRLDTMLFQDYAACGREALIPIYYPGTSKSIPFVSLEEVCCALATGSKTLHGLAGQFWSHGLTRLGDSTMRLSERYALAAINLPMDIQPNLCYPSVAALLRTSPRQHPLATEPLFEQGGASHAASARSSVSKAMWQECGTGTPSSGSICA